MKPLKIIFAGTPAFSLPCLQALHATGHDICAVFTQPDRPAGRGQKPQASVIKQWAESKLLPIFQPETLRQTDIQQTIANYKADVMVVVAYGLILPQVVLDTPKFGCINVHASLLPRWRGAAPIQYAIRSGDKETGITIMQMSAGMDSGDILKQVHCPILDDDTSETLFTRLSELAPEALLSTLENIEQGISHATRQQEDLVTYSPKIAKTEAHINWQDTSQQIFQNIRAFIPWPIAYTQFETDSIKIHRAHPVAGFSTHTAPPGTIIAHKDDSIIVKTGDGALAITHWQWPNHKLMSLKDWLLHKASQIPVGSMLQ
jgi:methionyl-tRNA formyltransferase